MYPSEAEMDQRRNSTPEVACSNHVRGTMTAYDLYSASPKRCTHCGVSIPYNKRANKFCSSSCSAKHNNPKTTGKRSWSKRKPCIVCGTMCARPNRLYCSLECDVAARYKRFIAAWLQGLLPGCTAGGKISSHVRRYLIENRGEKCEICGWNERNPRTGKIPICVDHIEGNWRLSGPSDLRLLCPNCHSLTPTYCGLNRGNAHPYRRSLYKCREQGVAQKQSAALGMRRPGLRNSPP